MLTEGEVRALIGACSKRAVTGIRNKALLAVLWRTGIRISEALDLMPYDVDFDRGTVRVRLGKGLKPRTTVLNNLDCLPLLQNWLQLRERLGAGEGAPLFCTLAGTRTATSYIRHLMPRLARPGWHRAARARPRAAAHPRGRPRDRWRSRARDSAAAWARVAVDDERASSSSG